MKDAIIVACINCATSVYAGFVVFSNLGYLAQLKNVSMSHVAKTGPGLAFVVYPEALTKMPFPVIWSICFFFMLTTLGLGSQFAVVETVMSGVEDEFRRLGRLTTKWSKMIFRLSLCVVSFFLGLPMVCPGGYYLLFLVDWSMSGYPLMFICVTEIVVICYSYGLNQFKKDVELMINERPNWYWRICWLFITPCITVSLIIFSIFSSRKMQLDTYVFPNWAENLAYLICAFPISCIPIWFTYKYCSEGGWILFQEFLKPVSEWGPAQDEHRAEFISMIRSNESLKRKTYPASAICLSSAFIPPGLGDNDSGATSIKHISSTTQMGSALCLDHEYGFFQSKLSVAEKLTQAHTKELAKKANMSDLGQLTASQLALSALAVVKEIQPYSVIYENQQMNCNSNAVVNPTEADSKPNFSIGPAIPEEDATNGQVEAKMTINRSQNLQVPNIDEAQRIQYEKELEVNHSGVDISSNERKQDNTNPDYFVRDTQKDGSTLIE